MEKLADKLAKEGWINFEQYNLAIEESAKTSKSIWAALVKLGFLREEDISLFFAQESAIPFVRICDYKIDPDILSLFNEKICIQNIFIPLFKIKNSLFVAFANPLDAALTDNLAKISGCVIEPLVAAPHSILSALDLYWHLEDGLFKMADLLTKQAVVAGVSLWRESQRLALKLPVKIKVEDDSVKLSLASSLEGQTYDISNGGTAIGLGVFLFLPKGLKVAIEFLGPRQENSNTPLRAKGEIVYSRMEKSRKHLLGIKFSEIEQEVVNQLLKLADQG